MTDQFPHLLRSMTMRGVTLPNRIAFTGHNTRYTDRDGLPDDRAIAYYAARARGGAGLQITGFTNAIGPGTRSADIGRPTGGEWYVGEMPLGLGRPEQGSLGSIWAFSDRIVPRYRAIAEAVHAYGGRFFAQVTLPVGAYEWEINRVTHQQIATMHEALAAAAGRAVEAGLDGVELHMGTAYMPHRFISARYNARTDGYGGDLGNRLRFVHEAISAIRRAIGEERVFGLRLAAEELVDDGYTLEDAQQIARRLTESGEVDYLNVIVGVTDDWISVTNHVAASYKAQGHLLPYARAIKQAVSVPVIGVGRIIDPLQAEAILSRGDVDIVGMTRAQIADSDLVRKIREGRLEDIRPCVGCVQMCIGEAERHHPIGCVYNSVAGRENIIGDLTPVASPKTVVVVGGGPGGMEAARVAATRGHRVTLMERSARLGGLVPAAATIPGRAEFGKIAGWLEGQVRSLGVEVCLNTSATADVVRRARPDVVVLATGSRPLRPSWWSEQIPAYPAQAVLLEGLTPAMRVTVVDTDGHFPGVGAADALAAAGHTVRLISPRTPIGDELENANVDGVYRNLLSRGVEMLPGTAMVRVAGLGRIVVADVFTQIERELDGVDALVFTDREPEDSLYQELVDAGLDVRPAGDCLTPRRVDSAVREAFDIAYAL